MAQLLGALNDNLIDNSLGLNVANPIDQNQLSNMMTLIEVRVSNPHHHFRTEQSPKSMLYEQNHLPIVS